MAAGSDDDVVVKFGASTQAVDAAISKLTGVFGQLAGSLAAVGAVLAGGAAFGKFLEGAKSANLEAMRFSRQLGLTGEEVGTLQQALSDVGSDMGAYAGAFQRFNRNLRTNGDEMRRMGVDVDAFNKGTKTGNEIFMESLQILAKYKPGIDQTQAAMRIFGSRVGDVNLLMRLNKDVIEAARKKNEELNLTITEEGVAAAEAYRAAMDDVGDVYDGFVKTVGEGMMPLFTQMSQQFIEMGPTIIEGTRAAVETAKRVWESVSKAVGALWDAVKQALGMIARAFSMVFGQGGEVPSALEIFKNTLRLIESLFRALQFVVESVTNAVTHQMQKMAAGFEWVADLFQTMWGVLRGEKSWEDVKIAWAKGLDKLGNISADYRDKQRALWAEYVKDTNQILVGEKPEEKKTTPMGRDKVSGSGTKSAPDDMREAAALAQANLALLKAQNEAALALERERDSTSMALLRDEHERKIASIRDFYARKGEIEQAALGREIEARTKEREALEKQPAMNAAGEIAKKAQLVALDGQINVLLEKRRGLAEANRLAAEKEVDAAIKRALVAESEHASKMAGLGVDAEQQNAQARLDLGEITADQMAQIEADLERRRYEIQRKGLDDRMALEIDNEEELRRLRDQGEAAYREHQNRLTVIANRAERQRRDAAIQAQQSARQSLQSVLGDWIRGVGSLGSALQKFAIEMGRIFTNLIAQKFMERLFAPDRTMGKMLDKAVALVDAAIGKILDIFIGGEAKKTAATAEGTAAREGIEFAAAAKSMALMIGSTLKAIAAFAARAFAGTVAFLAPFMGPFAVPAAFGVMAAVVAAGRKVASAEKGWWQIPGDQIAQVHKDEMVLPAEYARGMREMIAGGGSRGGDTHLHVHAVDAASVERLFRNNGRALVDTLKTQRRRFAF